MRPGSAPTVERVRGASALLARTRRETVVRFGGDARLVAFALVFGVGVGGLLHRLLVWSFGRVDELAVVPFAPGISTRNALLRIVPWALIAGGAAAFAMTDRDRLSRWGWRRAVGFSLAAAGATLLVVGELEVHVFHTLAQRWPPHTLSWDVLYHVPGEAIAFAGWLLLPTRAAARPAAD